MAHPPPARPGGSAKTRSSFVDCRCRASLENDTPADRGSPPGNDPQACDVFAADSHRHRGELASNRAQKGRPIGVRARGRRSVVVRSDGPAAYSSHQALPRSRTFRSLPRFLHRTRSRCRPRLERAASRFHAPGCPSDVRTVPVTRLRRDAIIANCTVLSSLVPSATICASSALVVRG